MTEKRFNYIKIRLSLAQLEKYNNQKIIKNNFITSNRIQIYYILLKIQHIRRWLYKYERITQKISRERKKRNIIFSLIVSRINRRTKNLYEIIINEENKEI